MPPPPPQTLRLTLRVLRSRAELQCNAMPPPPPPQSGAPQLDRRAACSPFHRQEWPRCSRGVFPGPFTSLHAALPHWPTAHPSANAVSGAGVRRVDACPHGGAFRHLIVGTMGRNGRMPFPENRGVGDVGQMDVARGRLQRRESCTQICRLLERIELQAKNRGSRCISGRSLVDRSSSSFFVFVQWVNLRQPLGALHVSSVTLPLRSVTLQLPSNRRWLPPNHAPQYCAGGWSEFFVISIT